MAKRKKHADDSPRSDDATPFIGCTVKTLPEEDLADAASRAFGLNPVNAPIFEIAAMAGIAVDVERLTLLTSKYWGPQGVDLSVQFLDNPDAETRRMILDPEIGCNYWGRFANIRFRETNGVGDVRVARERDGYWSYIGPDIRHIKQNDPTMNLEGFTSKTPASEYKRVVKHEFGHTLGFPHEHMRQEIIDLIDPQKAVAYFQRTQGWSAQVVKQQVLTPLIPREIKGTSNADQTSIMCYQLPASIMKNGQAIPGGDDLSEFDKAFVATIYPKSVGGGGDGGSGGNGGGSGGGAATVIEVRAGQSVTVKAVA